MTIDLAADEAAQERLCRFVAAAAGARRATIGSFAPLRGGAIQENWSVDIDLEGGAECRPPRPGAAHRRAPRGWPPATAALEEYRLAEARPGRRRGRAGAALAVQRSRRHRPRVSI